CRGSDLPPRTGRIARRLRFRRDRRPDRGRDRQACGLDLELARQAVAGHRRCPPEAAGQGFTPARRRGAPRGAGGEPGEGPGGLRSDAGGPDRLGAGAGRGPERLSGRRLRTGNALGYLLLVECPPRPPDVPRWTSVTTFSIQSISELSASISPACSSGGMPGRTPWKSRAP